MGPVYKHSASFIANIRWDINFLTKIYIVKAMVFPVVMYGCESWTIKKAEHEKNWCFWTVVLDKTLESPRRSNQSILKEISPEYSLEELRLKLKLLLRPPDAKNCCCCCCCCWVTSVVSDSVPPIDGSQPGSSVPGVLQAGILDWVASLEKTLMQGEIEDRKRRGWQRMRLLDGITDSRTWVWVSSRSWWWTGKPGMLQSMGLQRVGHDWLTELNWFHAYPGWFATPQERMLQKCSVFQISSSSATVFSDTISFTA